MYLVCRPNSPLFPYTTLFRSDLEGRPLLLHNECTTAGNWLALRLRGTGSNRDGIGAMVTIKAGGRSWKQPVTPSGSFMSSSDIRVHVGLGASSRADRIDIRWPGGKATMLSAVAANQILTIDEDR